MSMNLVILGLIFDILGVAILVIVTLFNPWYQKNYQRHWTKKYYWHGWRPIFKISPPSGKTAWRIKLNRKVLIYGFIPPRNLWRVIGFLFIFGGFILQIIGNMK